MKLFMKQSNIKKLEVFENILLESSISTLDLMKNTGVSKVKLQTIIHDVNKDLQHLFQQPRIISQTVDFQYYLHTDIPSGQLFHQIKWYYLEQSPHLKLIFQIMIEQRDWTMDDFSNYFSVSQSNLNQLICETNHMLENFGIQIMHTENERLTFTGEEQQIRLFLIITLLFSYQGFSSLIDDKMPDLSMYIDTNVPKSIGKQLMVSFYSITAFRMQEKFFITKYSDEIAEIFLLFDSLDDSFSKSISWIQNYTDDSVVQKKERLFMSVLFHSILFNLDDQEQRILVGKQMNQLDNELVQFCQLLIKEMEKEYEVTFSNDKYTELIYYATLMVSWIEYFQIDYSFVLSLRFSECRECFLQAKGKHYWLESFHEKLSLKYPDQAKYIEGKHHVFQLVVKRLEFLLNLIETEPIKVYIHYKRSILGESILKNKLSQLYNTSSMCIVEHILEADVIISDGIGYEKLDAEHFFFYDIENRKVWQQLFSFLQKKINENIL